MPQFHVPSDDVLQALVELLRILPQELYVALDVVLVVILPLDLQLLVNLFIGVSLLDHLFNFLVYFVCVDWPVLHHDHHSVVQA